MNEDYEIEKIYKIHEEKHLPVGFSAERGIGTVRMNDWLFDRAIPEKREGLDAILEKEGVKSRHELLIKNLGLSLSDHYWVKNEKEGKSWKEVNFYENEFESALDDIYIGEEVDAKPKGINPNGSSSGMLPKKWIIQEGKRHLMKGSESLNGQEPYNEVIASKFLDIIGVDHVAYKLVQYKGNAYSLCENMLGNENELVSAYYVNNINKRDNKISHYENYIENCKKIGFTDDVRQDIDKMITVDYLIANTDRHWSNFGIVRNAENLKPVCIAPLYDNGASFFTKISNRRIINNNMLLPCQSFKGNQEDNIIFVKDFSWLDKEGVNKLPALLHEGLEKNQEISSGRREIIVEGIGKRIQMIKKYTG
jgi:hypothetical protein